jgi:hypothetical protein
MDQRKLDIARRALGVDTETEAIDQALALVALREELADGFAAVRRSGGIYDVVERRSPAFGLWAGRGVDGLAYERALRQEWPGKTPRRPR